MKRLALFVLCATFFLAGCGVGNDDVSVLSSINDATDVVPDHQDGDGAEPDVTVSTGDAASGSAGDAVPEVPDLAPVESFASTSPADRQRSQVVGGSEVQEDEQASTPVDAQAEPERASSSPVESPRAPAVPTGPAFDIPLPTIASPQASAAAPVPTDPSSTTSTPSAPLVVPEADPCPDCETGGELQSDLDGGVVNPEDAGFQAAAVAPTIDTSAADLVCAPGAAADCVEWTDEPDPTEASSFTGSGAGASATQAVDCDLRPWGRGCDGPVPADVGFDESSDSGPVGDADDVEDTQGVFVPQEVQDLLLADLPGQSSGDRVDVEVPDLEQQDTETD